jgi:threonine/homoserine/homoserine lactone efflux protein
VTALLGVLAGFFSSAPVGPVNLAAASNGLKFGFRSGFLTGVGALIPDLLYLAVALLGLSHAEAPAPGPWTKGAGAAILLGVGVHDLRQAFSRGSRGRTEPPGDELARGVLLCLTNPFVLFYWIGVLGFLRARGWLAADAGSGLAFIAGVAYGGALWFLLLAGVSAAARRHVGDGILKAAGAGSGLLLIGLALYWCADILRAA